MAELQDFQQGSHCHRKTWINILLGILQLLLPCVQHGGAQLQALSQMSTSVVEVWQPEDADPLVPLQMEKDRRKDGLPLDDSSSPYTQENGRALQFQPPALDFGMQPLWLARAETIYIHNPSQEVPVMLLSMFTSSRQFYIPFFHRRVIEPKGKASFKLIFLPSEEDNIENTLFINTSSHGLLSYQVFGIGVHQGSLKSVQRKDSLLIFPHIHSIKLTQTQEDTANITILGLLLEGSLPKSLFNNPQGSCLKSEEHISLQINLSARSDRLADLDKLKPYIIEHILVLLMAPAAGQASVGEQRIGVYMLNSGSKKLYVKDMQVLSKVEASLKFNQVLLRPEAKNFTEVAALGCRGSFPGHGGKCINHISLKILGNWTTHGFPGLHITDKRTEMDLLSPFQVKQTDEDKVDVWMTNSLVLPLTVMNFSLSQTLRGVMKVVNFSSPFIVPHGCWLILSLQLLSRALPINQLSTLSLETSLGTAFKIPLYFQSTLFKHGDVVFEAERECGRPCSLRLSETGRSEWQRSLLPDFFKSSWPLDSKLAAEICSRWQSHKDKLPCRWPRLPIEASLPLDFGATPVNESKVKTFILKNPSATVVSIEIRILSLYPAPLEALDLLTKWFNISPLSINISTKEFSLLASPNQPDENLEDLTRKGVLRLLLQPWESREVAVVFTPSDDTPTTTILIIRNNLTVFDMKVVEGHGAKELLRVGGKLPGPGGSLRFNVPQSILMECRDGLRTNKPLFPIRKSFKVENAGELPLTVMSMKINGYKCQGFGFEVLQCRSFSLDHNTSSEITIAFTPDFTSSWVIRDLTLVTSRGTSFPFTLNVTLPHHMLPLCAQVVPGPSWEETFWVITLIFTCFSLFGVCLMAFHQAQYILNEFSTPLRSHHNSVLSRDNGPVNNITPNGVNKSKGSCKSYVDTCHTSDKGKGRGSPALANNSGPRPQSSKKNSSVTPQQTQKKHKVSLYYTKYKSSLSTAPSGSVAVDEENEDLTTDPTFTSDSDVCNNNKPDLISELDKKTSANFKEGPHSCIEDGVPATVMFPMEISSGFPDNVILSPGPRPGLLVCSPIEKVCIERYEEKMDFDKRDCLDLELREDGKGQKKKAQSAETGTFSGNNRGKRSRRKTDGSASEHKVVVMPEREKEPDWKTGDRNISGTRNRNRGYNGTKLESPKPGQSAESPLKQYAGVCPARTRRKCITDRRGGGLYESGSDSGSSSGSVRTSRGSWGSWSSASSMEGDRDPSSRAHACTTSSRKREPVQYSIYPVERDCYQTTNTNYKALRVNSLYDKDQCQSPDPPVSCFAPSFAAVAAGVDRNVEKDIQNVTGQYLPEETWSAPSIPLTNEFRYNTTEALPYIPQPATTASYNGFTWSSANSQCNSPYVYADQGNYIGNGTFPSGFPCQEGQPAHGSQTSWSEEQPQESPLTWDTAACVGSKPYFSGTRSLSPMSSLFGSIWTPQSEPYRSHFQPERSAPMSPVSPITPPCSPFSREAEGRCAPIQYSSFHPFGPHMNLDIWNSSSNRSSNSQLSNDSGYCGDV